MDYQYITATAGPEAARRIEHECDDFVYRDMDPEELDALARGAVVLGVETIGYPLPDGIIIYLRQPAGGVVAVCAETGADSTGLYDLIFTKVATIQEGKT